VNEELPADRPLVAKSPRWTAEEEDLLKRLTEEGQSVAQIAERLKRTETAVRKRGARIGISLKRALGKEAAD
jgi:DNA-binding NarL/FixJ family response regulator